MKKILIVLLSILMVSGCSKPQGNDNVGDDTPVLFNILAPKGATSLALVNDMANGQNTYDLVDGSDLLITELARSNSEYDFIVAPVNLGTKLYMAEKSTYKLAGIITWGNLYLVGTKPLDEIGDESITAFGEVSVPGKILALCLEKAGITNEVVYYNAVSEAQAEILSNKTNYALIAEPALSVTIAKAKQNGQDLQIVLDLQAVMEEHFNAYGFPQAGIFVKEDTYVANKEAVDTYLELLNTNLVSANADNQSIFNDIEKVGADTLGIPNAEIAIKSYQRQNIKYANASQHKEALKIVLDLFQIQFDDSLFLK